VAQLPSKNSPVLSNRELGSYVGGGGIGDDEGEEG